MSGAGEEEYEDINSSATSPSSFPSPIKGGNGVNYGLSSPGGYNDPLAVKTAGITEFQRFESQFSLNLNNVCNDEAQIKPLSPSTDQVDEVEINDDVDGRRSGVKTLAELKSFPVTSGIIFQVGYTKGVHDESEEQQEENPGWESPASSQGSVQSIEYLAKQTEAIDRQSARAQETFPSLENVLPKQVYKVIEGYLKDKDGLDRFMSHFTKDVMSTAYYTGACQRNSIDAEMIKKHLESHDPIALIGIIGRIMTKICVDQMGKTPGESTAQTNEEMDTGMVEESIVQSEPVSGRLLNKEIFENRQSTSSTINTCTDVVSVKQEHVSTSSASLGNNVPVMPNVPEFAADAAAISSGSKRKNTPDKLKCIATQIQSEIWDNANDQLRASTNKDKQIEKIGQIFFDAVFTQEEKTNCTLSGKKGRLLLSDETPSTSGTRPFDICKVRFIRCAVAFILSTPSIRNQRTFIKSINDPNFKDLDKDEEEILKKKVLTEYAYRKRPKKCKK